MIQLASRPIFLRRLWIWTQNVDSCSVSFIIWCKIKMMPGDDHIICYENIVSGWCNNHYSWIRTEKQCLMMIISYIVKIQSPDDIITVMAEFTLRNGVQCIYIHIKQRNCPKWLVWYQNRHHGWIHVKKLVLEIYKLHILRNYQIWLVWS